MAPPPPSSITDLAVEQALGAQNKTLSSANTPAKPVTSPELAPLDPSKLTIELTTSPKPVSPPRNWGLEDVTTDHMLIANWTAAAGWSAPRIQPYQRLDLFPTASCLHYATECFEGLKAYRGYDGKVSLFRPSRNAARMLTSSTRIALPAFSPDALEELVKQLLAIDGPKWVPEPGTFIYIRPTMIGTGRALGVQQPVEASLFIVMSLFPKLDKPMKLLASSEDSVRAWPGGFGSAKVGANYGPSLVAQKAAAQRGFDQILWLFGKEGIVTEAGASNFFVVIKEKGTGKKILLTAPLTDKVILDGVTRRSIIEAAKEQLADEVEVVERKYTMPEIVEAYDEGRLIEAFAAGTAYFVAPVTGVEYKGKLLDIGEKGEEGVTAKVKQALADIMYGKRAHEWGVVVEEKGAEVEEVKRDEVEKVKAEIKKLMESKAWLRAIEEVKGEIEANRK